MKRITFYKVDEPRSLRAFMKRAVEVHGDKIEYIECSGKFASREYTFKDTIGRSYAFATAIKNHEWTGKHFAIIGENCRDWVVSYLAVVTGMGVLVPMDVEMPTGDLARLTDKGDVDIYICTKMLLPKVKEVMALCPRVKELIVIGDDVHEELSFNTLIAEGKQQINLGDDSVLALEPNLDSVAMICFTSGTTGPNKGVMLTERNILAAAIAGIKVNFPGACGLSVLPMQHTYESCCHIWIAMYWGATVCFNDALKNLMWNIERFRPTIIVVVPLFLETIAKNIRLETRRNGLTGYFDKGVYWSGVLLKLGIDMRRRIFKPILSKFGGRLTHVVCGGAHLNPDVEAFFRNIGIDIINGYGITECSPLVTTHSTAWQRPGSVGVELPGEQIKVINPDDEGIGEICVKGQNVMKGYYKDPDATRATFTEDGWFNTGDLGYIRKHGKHKILYLAGRKKNLIVLSNGKNVHPEEIEQRMFAAMPYIKDGMVFGYTSSESQLICLTILPDYDAAKVLGIDDVPARVREDVNQVNLSLAPHKRVQKIHIRDEEFVKTPTKKIIRNHPSNQEV